MDRYQQAWESFLLTGSVDDYMTYCAKRKEELFTDAGGARAKDAATNERRRPAGQENRG